MASLMRYGSHTSRVSLGRVMMRFDTRSLDERVAPVEEFTNVATIVLPKDKLSTRMEPLVAFEVEDEVVEDEQGHARDDSLVYLLIRINQDVVTVLEFTARRNHCHISLSIGAPVEALKDHDETAESAQADQAN